ncbi:MAG: hypothetical protein KDA84_21180, partial [Planctomycetaceae bacterium]|nr:hypothetical protein [Planctomycetaceae bacterium]
MSRFMETGWRLGTANYRMQQDVFQGMMSLFSGLWTQQNQLLMYQFEAATKLLNQMIAEDRDSSEVRSKETEPPVKAHSEQAVAYVD